MSQQFLSCDWGTSSFRLRLIDADTLRIEGESTSNEGVAAVYAQWQEKNAAADRMYFYCAVLSRHIKKLETILKCDLEHVPIIISGMASSTIGIKELPYKQMPFSAAGDDLYYELVKGSEAFHHSIILISGVRSEQDVMRGEETQLAGCVQDAGTDYRVYIFPGTHSKHVAVDAGYAIRFETYMTGEFFQLLSVNSILSKSISPNGSLTQEENKSAFTAGVLDSRHQNLLHASFMVRTNDLFGRFSKEQNYWYLSGMIIGTELSALVKGPIPPVTIVASGHIAASYKAALNALGAENVNEIDVDEALIRAHAKIYQTVKLN